MTYRQAQNRGVAKIIIGGLVSIISFISFTITMLKALHLNAQNDQTILQGINKLIQNFINEVYINTQFLKIFWEKSPSLSEPLASVDNLIIILIYYIFIGLGVYLFKSGKIILSRLRKIKQSIEDDEIYNSMQNISNEEIEVKYRQVVQDEGFLNKLHSLYLAPIIVAIISTVILKFI